MTKEELKQRFNVKDIIDKSNAKIETWSKWSDNTIYAELKYISLPEYDIYIKGIPSNIYNGIKVDVNKRKTITSPYLKNEADQDFYVKHGVNVSNILALGSNKINITHIHDIIIKKFNVTNEFILDNTIIDYQQLLSKLYYKEYILITKQLKNYKPVKYF